MSGAQTTSRPAPLGRAELAALAAAVAHSPPDRLERIVAMLDALPERGDADRVLDAARIRLRELRCKGRAPQRPLNVTRLLFLPLDGAIVAPGRWRPGEGQVPRNALAPLAAMIERAAPEAWNGTVARMAGLRLEDHEAVAARGAHLWRGAASVLGAAAALPEGWTAAGLRPDLFAPLAALCASVLSHGGAIHRAVAASLAGPPEKLVRDALRGPAAAGREVLAAALTTLLRSAAKPGSVTAIAAGMVPAIGPAADAALMESLAARLPDVPSLPPEALPDSITALREMLDDAAQATSGRGPDWRKRLDGWRHGVETACRTAYAEIGRERVLAPAARLAAGTASDDDVRALEEDALSLRRLELAARTLGGEGAYDAARRAMLQTITGLALGTADPVTRVELSRLAEVVGGAEAGLALLPG